jgi:hypothetical protein
MAMSERDRKILIIGGVAAGALILLFLLFSLLTGGGSEPPLTSIVPGNNPPPKTKTPTPSPSVVASFAGRDPFAVPSALASALSATPSSSTSTSSSSTPTPTPTSTLTRQTSVTTRDGKQVALMDTFVRNGVNKAHVQVQTDTFTVREGEVFAGSFQLTSITGDCATIDYGDESFDLCSAPS